MTREQNETISVIVPVYKVEPYLRQCVDSVLAQTWQDLEIILVDDGSPDRCGAICDEYAARDARIVVLHQPNAGLSAARNAGLALATGKYVTFLDSDDFIAPTMLETLHRRMQATNAELVLCNMQYTDEAGEPIEGKDPSQRYKLPETVWTQEQFWEQKRKKASVTYTVSCSKLYLRRLFKTVRFPVGKTHEDEFVLHPIIDQCSRIAAAAQSLYFYRQRAGSITADPLNPGKLDRIEACLARAAYACQKRNYDLLRKTVFDMLDLLEWFAYESERAGRPLPERYEPLRQQVMEFIRRPVRIFSPVYWGVVLSYRWGIFPYKFLRELYWGVVNTVERWKKLKATK